MPRRPTVARTSITLPPGDLSLADRLAARLDRSRSWVFAEAIRRWGSSGETQDRAAPTQLPEPQVETGPDLPLAVDPAAGLRLSPTARLQRAQELTAQFRRDHPRAERIQIVAFGSLQDFRDWKGPA
jgi:hypothetical protein